MSGFLRCLRGRFRRRRAYNSSTNTGCVAGRYGTITLSWRGKAGRLGGIDFDLAPDFPLFDLWSLGNILHSVLGRGVVAFRDALGEQPELSGWLCDEGLRSFSPTG